MPFNGNSAEYLNGIDKLLENDLKIAYKNTWNKLNVLSVSNKWEIRESFSI